MKLAGPVLLSSASFVSLGADQFESQETRMMNQKRKPGTADRDRAVAEDEPVLRWIAACLFESKLFVEDLGCLQVFHG